MEGINTYFRRSSDNGRGGAEESKIFRTQLRDILANGKLDVRIGASRVSVEEIYLDADTLKRDFMSKMCIRDSRRTARRLRRGILQRRHMRPTCRAGPGP